MNLRPSGYEPDELPDCSTPHQKGRAFYTNRAEWPAAVAKLDMSLGPRLARPTDLIQPIRPAHSASSALGIIPRANTARVLSARVTRAIGRLGTGI